MSANADAARTGTVTIAGQTFTVAQTAAPPAGWSHQDIGAVSGSPADGVRAGDVDLQRHRRRRRRLGYRRRAALRLSVADRRRPYFARVTSVQNTNVWTKAGVMIRETLDAGSAKPSCWSRSARAFRISAAPPPAARARALPERWRRAVLDSARSRWQHVHAYQSRRRRHLGAGRCATIAMGPQRFIGLAVSSHTTTATRDGDIRQRQCRARHAAAAAVAAARGIIRTSAPSARPAARRLNTGNNTYTVKGAGADIWGTADAFHYAYRTMTGDGVVIARVATVQNTNAWTQGRRDDPRDARSRLCAGVDAGLVQQGPRVPAPDRAGGTSTSTGRRRSSSAPYWVKLERIGTRFNAYVVHRRRDVDARRQRHDRDGRERVRRPGDEQSHDRDRRAGDVR